MYNKGKHHNKSPTGTNLLWLTYCFLPSVPCRRMALHFVFTWWIKTWQNSLQQKITFHKIPNQYSYGKHLPLKYGTDKKFSHTNNNRIIKNVLLQRSSQVTVLQTEKLQHKAVHKTMCINVSSILYGQQKECIIHSPAISSVTTFMLSKAGNSEVGGL